MFERLHSDSKRNRGGVCHEEIFFLNAMAFEMVMERVFDIGSPMASFSYW
jgi:hypothetical protein